ncbi:uncharacterized protein BX663DRAFT_526891 [Cokeromyces recurvatus]|uniref:uncharacterized protein n=1 Tax=Cokeromyces recurvatus TaxID=90255 RepID=UPI002220DCCD|nr:uncharacterized protein BX663DRAFT_526891 [Cokeromyces recurvatus]KAI7897912.1 hypothetical protein BX663DRAFT_526891 [Cokeromyces recurvatus]
MKWPSLIIRFIKLKKFNLFLLILLFLFLSYLLLTYSNTLLSYKTTSLFNHDTDEERYLAYLPHSGLSNQRIELANALLLAYMLKRTLIVPPAFLGTVLGWMHRDQLMDRLEWLTTPKNFPKICQRPTPGLLKSYTQRSRCAEYRQLAILPWTELHDFTLLKESGSGIRMQFQSIISLERLKEELEIMAEDDVYVYQDLQLYDWRLYQNKTRAIELVQDRLNYFDSFAGRRYYKVLLPDHFERRKEKLIYLGGIFGSTRIHLIDSKDLWIQELIRRTLHYRLDTPIGETVKSIVNYLGGKGSFMALHFRTGDNPFKREIPDNLLRFVKNMTDLASQQRKVITQNNSEESCLNLSTTKEEEDHLTVMNQQQLFSTLPFTSRVKIYLATDYRNPKGKSSLLLPWFDTFPCTTILSDLPDYLFSPLDHLRDSIVPSKSLRHFLIPLVDAMVAAHGKTVLTTPRSTFSKYIEELHYDWLE